MRDHRSSTGCGVVPSRQTNHLLLFRCGYVSFFLMMSRERGWLLLHPHHVRPSLQPTAVTSRLCRAVGGNHPAGHAEPLQHRQQNHGGGCGSGALAGGATHFGTVAAVAVRGAESRQIQQNLLAVADRGGGAGTRLQAVECARNGAGLECGAHAADGGAGARWLCKCTGDVRRAEGCGWNGAVFGGAGKPSRAGIYTVLHQCWEEGCVLGEYEGVCDGDGEEVWMCARGGTRAPVENHAAVESKGSDSVVVIVLLSCLLFSSEE